jgi:hypothetical protein
VRPRLFLYCHPRRDLLLFLPLSVFAVAVVSFAVSLSEAMAPGTVHPTGTARTF